MKEKSTSVNKIANYIRKEIMCANLKSEEHLKEVKISKLFGVSRVPVREALRILHSEGYVEMIPNRGSFVKKMSADYIHERTKVYNLIATELLNNAIPKYKDSTYKKADLLVSKLEKCKEASRNGYLFWDFAKVIYSTTEFKLMFSILDDMHKYNIRVLNDVFYMKQLNQSYDITPLKKFIKLCRQNKKDEAIKVWCEHINKIGDDFIGIKQSLK